jgi:hypothetical protein
MYRRIAAVIVAMPWATAVFAADRTTVKDFDFQLRAGSAAVDAGVRLPGVNDDFTGRTPDLGAYEVGRPLPHYGPRP